MNKHLLFAVVLLLSTITVFSQNYNVEFYNIEGELSSDDLLKPEFGRYDGYKLPMTEGELATFIVYSEDFNPIIVMVTPEDKVYFQSKKNPTGLASFTSEIPETGEWILYVLGGKNDLGNYLFQYGFANKDAQVVPDSKDFCGTLNFLKSHSTAHFVFLEQLMGKNGTVKFKGAYDAYLNGSDASYNIVMYDGNDKGEAEKIYSQLGASIKACDDKFSEKKNNWSEQNGYKEKSTQFILAKEKESIIKVIFFDYTNLEDENVNNYSIEVVVMKSNE